MKVLESFYKPDITYLMPCWDSPELLEVSVPSLIASLTLPSQIIIILHDYDEKSVEICRKHNVEFICNSFNYGPAGVDLAYCMIRGSYVSNVNSDMLFYPGWDKKALEIIEKNYPCSVSPMLVEPNPATPFVHFNPGPWGNPDMQQNFNDFIDNDGPNKQTKLEMVDRTTFSHPILVKFKDFADVGGYSGNFNNKWFEVSGGRGLDNDFAFRLWKHHDSNFKFILSASIFCYHGGSLGSTKIAHFGDANEIFLEVNGVTSEYFYEQINNWEPLAITSTKK